MSDDVTEWIDRLRQGDASAAEKLWRVYFVRMVQLAYHKLKGARPGTNDGEDIALSAFKSFCIAAREGRYSKLTDRTNLWPLLVAITANKSVDAIRRENRKKRGGEGTERSANGTRAESNRLDAARREPRLSELISSEPEPEFAVLVADEFEALLRRLDAQGDPDLKVITLAKLQGESNLEIAEQLRCARRTVERKLQLIERLLRSEASTDE
ncbi:MAG: ECF-type sigma factor [Pirellulaceae bacterium]